MKEKILEYTKSKLNIRSIVRCFIDKKIDESMQQGIKNAENAVRGIF